MTRHTTPGLTTAALALVISAVILASTTLDASAPSPLAEARAAASHTELAQRLEAVDQRLNRAALALCTEEQGPGATAHWASNDELICQPAPQPGAVVAVMLGESAP